MNTDNSANYKNLMLKKPKWFIQYGSGLMLLFLLVLLLMSYLIKYPEYIDAEINVVSEDHIKRLISKKSGNVKLLLDNGSLVKAGEELAYIENPTIQLKSLTNLIDSISNQNLIENPNFILPDNISLGELEPYYIDFLKKRKDFFIFENVAAKKNNKNNLHQSLLLNKQVKNNILKEREISNQELLVEREKLTRAKNLQREGIISKSDLNKAEQDFLEFQKRLQNNITTTSQVAVNEIEVSNNINNLEYQIKEDEIKYRQELENSFSRLRSEVNNWKFNNSFISPTNGKLVFNNNWSDGQFISESQEFGAIIPTNSNDIFCSGLMKSFQSGKVKKGQKVKIYLDGFNFEEYGILEGSVDEIYPIPERSKDGKYFYKLKIKLIHGLVTSLNKKIPYTPDLNGNAKIVTMDISLLERLFLKIVKAVDN